MEQYRNTAEAKLASIAWKLKLIQTSAKVTRTTGTTLKSLLLDVVVKEEGPACIKKIGKCLVMLDSAISNPDPLVKKDYNPLPQRIY